MRQKEIVMALLFKKLGPSVTDDNVNYIHFESDCVVHPKHSFDSAGISYFITFFFFYLQKLYFMQTSLIIPITATYSFFFFYPLVFLVF